ncbi:MAB_1171c family putative transporter [Nocardia terpenica]|uniref:DUF6545 domain-containing protein n=1 Tax=Nocardia terpenica TaxID=455432 RepID=A0A6G9Z6R7_9NOCA|nr:MAB_1171c family putative transporter [Nocardia terpenica]QIS21047.1 hypothetical protein F6W96_24730 [Nocardia terpenica]
MNHAQIIRAVTHGLLLVWLLSQIARAPKNVPLRALGIYVVCWGLGFIFGIAADAGHASFVGDSMTAQEISNLLELVSYYSLVCFFLFTVYSDRVAKRRALAQAPLPVLVGIVMVIAVAMIPGPVRATAAQPSAGKPLPPHDVVAIESFWLIFNAYTFLAYGYAAVISCRYARRGHDPWLRQAMMLLAAGAAGQVLALATFMVANVGVMFGHPHLQPGIVLVVGVHAAFLGTYVFLIGLGYRSARMRLAAVRVWVHHRRDYRLLQPLWRALHAQFPEDSLDRAAIAPWRDAMNLRGVHRRFYRRAIECRDGLVRISPYIAKVCDDGLATAPLAVQLTAALDLRATGEPVREIAVPIALPTTLGFDADVDELITLSRALATTATALPAGR